MKTDYDIIVIGAGIAGISLAAELSKSAQVLVLETETQPGYHSTGRSAAYFAPTYGNDVIRTLTQASESFFRDPPTGFTEATLVNNRQAMFIGRKDQSESIASTRAELGKLVTVENAEQSIQRVPILSKDYIHQSVIDPSGGDLDVDALLQAYLRLLRSGKGQLMSNAKVQNMQYNNEQWLINTHTAAFTAPIVVNAAGAWADQVAHLAGLDPLGLVPKRRTAFLIDAPQDMDISDWPLVVDIDESFYFKPDAGTLLISPADETPSNACDAAPEDLDVAIAVERFETATDISVKRINHKWAGLRTFASDKTPVVGLDPRAKGFFWMAGQGGYGVQTAPAMAKLGAALVLDKILPETTRDCALKMSPTRLI